MRRAIAAVVIVAALFVGSCSDDDPAAVAPSSTSTSTNGNGVGDQLLPTGERPGFTAVVETVTAGELPASWRPGCPLAVEELRRIRLSHWGFDGAVHDGVLIVAADVADDVRGIFRDLFDAGYAIERMEPVDVYGGSDEASTAANNTSAFNCRLATGGTGWSEHAFGRAIDLNPLQNPYVRGDEVLPPQSARYLDRTHQDQGVIHDGDPAVTAFGARGWIWGGHWRSLKDYQHFSPTGR